MLLGCTGEHEIVWPNNGEKRAKRYILNRPGYEGESAWAPCPHIGRTQVQSWSEDNATVRGAKMMELI